MNVRVGLDFGTHQTKVCVNYQKPGQVQVFEFINFGTKDSPNLFLPSILNIHEDDRISVGNSAHASKSYRYFKIASAEDEAFRGISGLDESKEHYDLDRFDSISPELLSIIFLTHTIGIIKDRFEKSQKPAENKSKKGSFLGRFLGGKDTNNDKVTDHDYFFQIGIPTEWSAEKNRWRRRKFEQILYLANDIIDTHSYSFIRDIPFNTMEDLVKKHYEILERKLNYSSWIEIITNGKISAFPETAAGLTYLVKTEKIREGYYLALDIGGGSSDISFFRVHANRTFEYLASESLMIASNDVYTEYRKASTNNDSSIENVQQQLRNTSETQLEMDEYYKHAYKHTMSKLSKKIKRIYNERVYWHFKKTVANQKFNDQSCYLYGGGSLLHRPTKGIGKLMDEILLHDQGTEWNLNATRTYAEVDPVINLDVPHHVKPDGWEKYLPLLIVPLGLSYIQPDQTYDWNDTLYKPGEGFYHIDDDPTIFDVFRRRWV